MTDNPYAAPKAPVSDYEADVTPKERPRQVVWAVRLLVANWVLAFCVVVLNWNYYVHLGSPAVLICGQMLSVAIYGWIYFKIWHGRNWARIVLAVFTGFGLIGLAAVRLSNLTANAPASIRRDSIVSVVVGLVVIWLLFFSPGKTWFQPRD